MAHWGWFLGWWCSAKKPTLRECVAFLACFRKAPKRRRSGQGGLRGDWPLLCAVLQHQGMMSRVDAAKTFALCRGSLRTVTIIPERWNFRGHPKPVTLIGGSLAGVWNGWGYGIAFFRALNFQISEPEILQKSLFLWNFGDFPAKFGLW